MVFFAVSKGSGVMDYVLAFKEESSTHRSISSSSISTSVMDGTSPDSVKGKKSTISIFTLYSSIYLLLLLSVFIFLLSLLSPSPVPPHIVHASAWPPHGSSPEALHWEGDPDQRSSIHTSFSPELQISGTLLFTESSRSYRLYYLCYFREGYELSARVWVFISSIFTLIKL